MIITKQVIDKLSIFKVKSSPVKRLVLVSVRKSAMMPGWLIVLAIVVDTHGFIKYCRFYRGNIKDDKTRSDILADMNYKQGENKSTTPVAFIDARITTGDNLKMLVNERYDYLHVALSKPKNYAQYLD